MPRTLSGLAVLIATLALGGTSHATPPKPVPHAAIKPVPQIAGGSADANTPEAAIVVQLSGPNGLCSGTLITPMAVLTANHCISGSDSNTVTNQPAPGIGYPISIVVYTSATTTTTYTSNNTKPTQTLGGKPQKAEDFGQDLAVVFLDAPGSRPAGSANFLPGPAAEYAQIVHPSLTAPCPTSGCSGDGDGGTYNPAFGMAGFAPQDSKPNRQVAYDSQYNHFPGDPDVKGQYWRHDQGSIHDDAGDSGGALFVRKPLPGVPGGYYRDLLGVISGNNKTACWEITCDHDVFTDITRGDPAHWLRSVIVDPTPRGANWQRMHPGYSWYGDLDYTGPCNHARDRDCDHWYNEHDNCPNLANWDQKDSNDDGVGDACPVPPPTAAPTCSVSASCLGQVSASCAAQPTLVALQEQSSGAWQTVASASPPYPHGVWMSTGQNVLFPGGSGTFRTCDSNASGQLCSPAATVQAPTVKQCTGSSSGGGTGGTGNPGCGPPGCRRGPVRD